MSVEQENYKKQAALAALAYIKDEMILGIGTGSTVNYFIEALASVRHKIEGVVASSTASAAKLRALQLPILDSNSVSNIPLYVDGADEATRHLHLIKGGGGALTGEKIIAANSQQFICIIDETKMVDVLGAFPIAIEVIPIARSYVARELVKLGGDPVYREGVVTDYGNVILDVYHLDLTNPLAMEQTLNQIAGVVSNGLFAKRPADILLSAGPNGVNTYKND